MAEKADDIKVLIDFLSCDLQIADEVFDIFDNLDGAQIYISGAKHCERFLFKKGAREDRMTLIAHADTIYDKKGRTYKSTPKTFSTDGAPIFPEKYPDRIDQTIVREGSIFKGANPDFGIGADDRAGCAILWLMRNSGHNVLLVDGEEDFLRGTRYLMREHNEIFDEIHKSRCSIEFDFPEKDKLGYYDTLTSDSFKTYITQKTGYRENPNTQITDIGILCVEMCAVNLSVGYYNHHTKDEYLDIGAWLKTLRIIRKISSEEIPKFILSQK